MLFPGLYPPPGRYLPPTYLPMKATKGSGFHKCLHGDLRYPTHVVVLVDWPVLGNRGIDSFTNSRLSFLLSIRFLSYQLAIYASIHLPITIARAKWLSETAMTKMPAGCPIRPRLARFGVYDAVA